MVVRLNYLFLTPWIVLSVPSSVSLGLGTIIVFAILVTGLTGTFGGRRTLVNLASASLLVLLVGGKLEADIAKSSSPDTLVLLLQFVGIIFFLEASRTVISFDVEAKELAKRSDGMSQIIADRLRKWVTGQLSTQAQLAIGALGLSLVLLVFGGFASISVDQLALSALLVLLVVGALIFLITQRREPDTRPSSPP